MNTVKTVGFSTLCALVSLFSGHPDFSFLVFLSTQVAQTVGSRMFNRVSAATDLLNNKFDFNAPWCGFRQTSRKTS